MPDEPAAAPLDYAAWREALRGEALPTVVVDLDAFDRNVGRVAQMLRGTRQALRLATKSVRVPALIERILAAGPPYRGLMCFTATEAEFLSGRGHDDLLVAYPTVQPSDLTALRAVHEQGRTVRMVVDSLAAAEHVAAAMSGVARPFSLVLEVDMSLRWVGGRVHLGVRRSPVRTVDEALAFCRGLSRFQNLRMAGVMGYEAQVAGLGDRNPFKKALNPVFRQVRQRSKAAIESLRHELAERLPAAGFPLELFNGGGTGSVNFATGEPWLTEITVGSGFLCSHLFDYYSNVAFEPACFFVLQVVRSSDAGYATCLGGGYIASGEPGWDKTPRPHLPAGLQLLPNEGCGEVQTPLRLPAGQALPLGAPVLMRHAKAGELAERFNEYLLVSRGRIVDRVPTYRGLGQCFL